MSMRDIDLVIAAALMGLATLLSRLADPALAIVLLSLIVAIAVVLVGEERLEWMWREYNREPSPPPPRRARPELVTRPSSPSPNGADRRSPRLAPARVVTRSGRSFARVAQEAP